MVTGTLKTGKRLLDARKRVEGFIMSLCLVLEVSQLDNKIGFSSIERDNGIIEFSERLAEVTASFPVSGPRLDIRVMQIGHESEANEWCPVTVRLPEKAATVKRSRGRHKFPACPFRRMQSHSVISNDGNEVQTGMKFQE